MQVWKVDYTGRLEIVPTEPFFTTAADAECEVTIQTGAFTGYCLARFAKADLERCAVEVEQLDRSGQGTATLVGRNPLGEVTCSLTIKATQQGHLGLSADLTHQEGLGSRDASRSHRICTGFDLVPSCLPGVRAELKQLHDLLFNPDTALHVQPPISARTVDPTWPGMEWRFLARDWRNPTREVFHLTGDGWTWFDELVVGEWFHLEWMHGRNWWLRVGDARIDICIPKEHQPIVTIERDAYYVRLAPEEVEAVEVDEDDDPFGGT